MAIKAVNYKNWCEENVSPQCWPRILLKSFDVVKAEGLQLKEVENPTDEMELSDNLLVALNQALMNIYEIEMEEGVLKS